jgi:hypothetical protein
MSKHTPGPWIRERRQDRWRIWDSTELIPICFSITDVAAVKQSHANLDLIAAAPDLLDALVHLLGYTEQLEWLVYAEGTPGMNETVSAAIDAIAKARGEADE